MCGIVGYVGKKQVVPVIIEGLRKLEYRGYDSAGIAVSGNGEGLQIRRAEGKLRNLKKSSASSRSMAPMASGHTRWARTAAPPRKTPIPIATAPAKSWSCTTALSKTTSRSRRN